MVLRKLLSAVFVFGLLSGVAQAADPAKPVVELFTSQGCSSCPPADAFLVELAQRGDVIALSLHVDYWNSDGWSDPFSGAGATQRQQAYRTMLKTNYVYTPQMVVDGATELTGSDRASVEKRIAAAKSRVYVPLEVTHAKGIPTVRIPAGHIIASGASVWVFDIDRRHSTHIERGENKGVTLTNANVVRKMTRIGSYKGEALDVAIDVARLRDAGRSGAVVLLQGMGPGRIFGAALVPIDAKSGS